MRKRGASRSPRFAVYTVHNYLCHNLNHNMEVSKLMAGGGPTGEVMDTVGHSGDEEEHHSFEERFEHPGKTWASVTHRKFSLQAVAVATVNAT